MGIHTIATKLHEGPVVRGVSKVIKGLEPGTALRGLVETHIGPEAQFHTTFTAFLSTAFGFAHMHCQTAFAHKIFVAVLATVFGLSVRGL